MKIGLRILLGYFVIVALAGWLLGGVFVQQVKPGVRQAMEDTLADAANVLAELATDDLVAGRISDGQFARRVRALGDRDFGARISGFDKRAASYRITVTDARGVVVFDSSGRDIGRDNSRWNDVYRTLRGEYGARSTRSDPNDENTSVMHVAAPILDRGRIVGVLTVAKPNQAIAPFIARSQGVILKWGVLLLGAALLIGVLASWWLSRQLGRLRGYAMTVATGGRAVLPKTAGEFADLGRALDTMRERLEGKQYVEQYVHALTHELKSPLTAIRGSAELLESADGQPALSDADRARFVATIRAQGDRMAQMIDKLLALAAVEHRQRLDDPQALDLRALVADAIGQVEAKAIAAGVGLAAGDDGAPCDVDADGAQTEAKTRSRDRSDGAHRASSSNGPPHATPGAAPVVGDAFLLRQALVNLLDNALDFAPRGSMVDVGVRRIDGAWHVDVSDRGAGVPDYAIERVFERFYSLPRPDGGSRSSGLGLCFVAQVAELHGGSAMLANRDGGGAVARMTLPAG